MKKILLALVFCASFAPISAKADYLLWQDAKSGLSVTFPDTWKKQINRNPETVLTIEGPANGDKPVCTINVSDDKRYTIFPPKYGQAVQKEAVSSAFWRSYMERYGAYNLDNVFDGGGLGRWVASYATGSWETNLGKVTQTRRGLMFASLYYNKLYVVECSTLNHAYDNWENDFKSIIKSIDFKKMYHESLEGNYEKFLDQADQLFWTQTGPEGTTAYN